MEVRIRHEDESRAKSLCDIEPTQRAIDDVVALLKANGGVYWEGAHFSDLSYQFVLDDTGAYVEIILSPDDE